LYNDPALVGSLGKPLKRSNIRTAVLKELSGLDALAGLIFLGSLERFHNYEKACRSREGFRIYDGDEGTFLDHPSAAGVLSAGANLAPRAWDQITRAALHLDAGPQEYPDHQQVWKWGTFLHQLKETYASHAAGVIKGVLWDMGILETPTCYSAPPHSEVATRQSAALLQRYGEFL
jgi:dihydrodipicolinate synthase/N-acetylneuraminate lyase